MAALAALAVAALLGAASGTPVAGAAGNATVYHVHIPKTAGTSFVRDAQDSQARPGWSVGFGRRENGGCSEMSLPMCRAIAAKAAARGDGGVSYFATFLRHPIKHVLSQFMHAKKNPYGSWRHPDFPVGTAGDLYSGLEDWLDFMLSDRPPVSLASLMEGTGMERTGGVPRGSPRLPDFGKYNPWNMQARYLAPPHTLEVDAERSDSAHHVYSLEGRWPKLEDAKREADGLFFLGITSLYSESLCIFRYRLSGGVLPRDCGCGPSDREPSKQAADHHFSHGIQAHFIDDLTLQVISKMCLLVTVDLRLFLHALDRFEADVQQVAEETGVQLICGDKQQDVDALRQQITGLVALAIPGVELARVPS